MEREEPSQCEIWTGFKVLHADRVTQPIKFLHTGLMNLMLYSDWLLRIIDSLSELLDPSVSLGNPMLFSISQFCVFWAFFGSNPAIYLWRTRFPSRNTFYSACQPNESFTCRRSPYQSEIRRVRPVLAAPRPHQMNEFFFFTCSNYLNIQIIICLTLDTAMVKKKKKMAMLVPCCGGECSCCVTRELGQQPNLTLVTRYKSVNFKWLMATWKTLGPSL